jgi:hypothetical protein
VDKLDAFNLKDFDRVKFSTSWMDSLNCIHMVDDIFDEFMYKMTPEQQVRDGKDFSDLYLRGLKRIDLWGRSVTQLRGVL